MERTVLERIVSLKGMIDRKEHIELVEKELFSIFEMINNEKDTNVKRKAYAKLFDLAKSMALKINDSSTSELIDLIEKLESKSIKTRCMEVHVGHYLDTTVIKTNKKPRYKELIEILNKVNNFNDKIEKLYSIAYDKNEKQFEIIYINKSHRPITIDTKSWNMNDDTIETYISGLIEYIEK